MKYSEANIATQCEILKRRTGGELLVPITVHSTALASGVCKAGTPLDKDGKVANTASAVGILLNDVYSENPNGSLIKAFASINTANAKANSGVTLADACIGALTNLVFE